MTKQEWQSKHGLTDEDMEKVALLRELFKASEIKVVNKGGKRGRE